MPGYGSLWRTDGTVCGSYPVIAQAQPGDITYSNGKILLALDLLWASPYGRELYVYSPGPSGCKTLAQSTVLEKSSQIIDENIKCYPNPFANEIYIRVNGDAGESYEALIIDVKGVHQGAAMQIQSNQDYRLGSELTPGVYILIINKRDERVVLKIVKTQ